MVTSLGFFFVRGCRRCCSPYGADTGAAVARLGGAAQHAEQMAFKEGVHEIRVGVANYLLDR
jgi:hypothetical protein